MAVQDTERLSGALQENLLTLLCFNDEAGKLIRHAVTPRLFESAVFREVAGAAIDFIDQFGVAIKDHLPDHLEHILDGDDTRKANTYKKLLDNLFLAQDSINVDYVISQLHKFVRQQTLKDAFMKAVSAFEAGDVERAEIALQAGLANQSIAFEPGLNLNNAADVVSILDHSEEEGFELGIPAFDRLGIMPRRKELFALIAPRKRGKSWFITHVAKHALLARWSVVIITLEMSERRYAARMLQSFFSISRREAHVKVTRLIQDKEGTLQDVLQEVIDRPTMQDADIREVLSKRANREFRRRPPIRIKEFATGSLTVAGLNAYLDNLERFEKFTPDLICIDYPRLMKLDAANLRLELGRAIEDIRGIGKTRNAAMVIVHQGTRESETAKLVSANMAAEDISLVATADVILTYSQTPAEKPLGLARLFADQVRNEESKTQVLITQAYALGQFCLDSAPIKGEYWDMMEDRDKGDRTRRRHHDDGDDDK